MKEIRKETRVETETEVMIKEGIRNEQALIEKETKQGRKANDKGLNEKTKEKCLKEMRKNMWQRKAAKEMDS